MQSQAHYENSHFGAAPLHISYSTFSNGVDISETSSDNSINETTDERTMLFADYNSDEELGTFGQGPTFVSRHRKVLNRIRSDSTISRRHEVPRRSGSKDRGLRARGLKAIACLAQTMANCGRTGDSLERQKSCSDWSATFLPMWSWLKDYKWTDNFFNDIIAGLTVGVMTIPQSMSYARLAGLPVEYGLYSALIPVYAYALFGSSRQLVIGPVAIISLLLSAGLNDVMSQMDLAEDVNPEMYQAIYTRLAVQTSFLVGLTYIVMGILRMGFVTIFLSHAVVSGFTTGASVIIGMSQVKYLVGYHIHGSSKLQKLLKSLLANIEQFNCKTFVMGCTSILVLIALKHIGRTIKRFKWLRATGPVAVTVITISLVVTLGLEEKGIPTIGHIPRGLPSFTMSELTNPFEDMDKLGMVVVNIVIVGFMESIATAKQLAAKHKYEIDASMELIGLGMANLSGGMFSAYPVTGSLCRSAINNESGAVSGISGVVNATLVMSALLFLTPVFEHMPLCVLAAIVISGVFGLVDYEEAIHLWKVHPFDFFVWLVACVGTMILGAETGLAIAVGMSLLIVIYESANPHVPVLGRLPGTTIYRNIEQYPEWESYDGIVLVRIDAPLYFANAQNIRDRIRKYRLDAAQELASRKGGDVKFVIIEIGNVSHIDTTALHILEDMNTNYCSRGQQLLFSNPNMVVMDQLVSSGLAEKVGRKHFFACLHDAVQWALHEMDCDAISLHESLHGYISPDDSVETASASDSSDDTHNDEWISIL